MNPEEGRPVNRKKANAIPKNILEAVASAIKADIAARREPKEAVKIDNPDCVEYPCQCSLT
jgi:hypothetical protein